MLASLPSLLLLLPLLGSALAGSHDSLARHPAPRHHNATSNDKRLLDIGANANVGVNGNGVTVNANVNVNLKVNICVRLDAGFQFGVGQNGGKGAVTGYAEAGACICILDGSHGAGVDVTAQLSVGAQGALDFQGTTANQIAQSISSPAKWPGSYNKYPFNIRGGSECALPNGGSNHAFPTSASDSCCIPGCPNGFERQGGQCVCPANKVIREDGSCQTGCAQGTTAQNGVCYPPCPENQVRINGACGCPPPKVLRPNGKCQNACLDNQVLEDGVCVVKCPAGNIVQPNGQCTCPPPKVLRPNGSCQDACLDMQIECNGVCYPKTTHTCSSGVPVPKHRRRHVTQCGPGLTMCATPWGVGTECLDITSDIESCGGCVRVDAHKGGNVGTDCTGIPNINSVSCQSGTCRVHSCQRGFAVNRNGTGCDEREGNSRAQYRLSASSSEP